MAELKGSRLPGFKLLWRGRNLKLFEFRAFGGVFRKKNREVTVRTEAQALDTLP